MRSLGRLVVVLVLATGGAAVVPGAASAGVPEYQRVIKARFADAALQRTTGCVQTEIFVSSSDSVFGGRPGPVNKQGLTSARRCGSAARISWMDPTRLVPTRCSICRSESSSAAPNRP